MTIIQLNQIIFAAVIVMAGCKRSPPTAEVDSVSEYLAAAHRQYWDLTTRYADSSGVESAKWLKRQAPALLASLTNGFTVSEYYREGDTARFVAAVLGSKTDNDRIQVTTIRMADEWRVHFVTVVGHPPQ